MQSSPVKNGGKILVTGGTGFLGAYIIQELVAQGYEVRAIRRSDKIPSFIPVAIAERVEWIKGDVLDIDSLGEAMDKSDAVIHAAAKVSFSPRERREMYKTNISGTANVMNAALEKKIKRMVYISSVAALGRTREETEINEGKQWEEKHLHTHYAISKYHAEMEVWRAIAEGLDTVIINPSTLLGYGDWNTGSCSIFKSVYNGFPWYTNGINGFVDVRDTAKLAVSLMQTDIAGERFIISGGNWSFRQLLNAIADGFGKKHPSKEATPILATVAWNLEKLKSVFSGQQPLLTKESAKIAMSRTYFDNSKIQQYLPDFRFTPLQQTVELACRAYQLHLQPV